MERKHRDIGLKPRPTDTIPTERLLTVLRSIYPDEIANDLYKKLTESESEDKA